MKALHRLFLAYSRHALRSEIQYVLISFVGLSLAIALFISIRLANETVLAEFQGAVDTVAGSSTFQIIPRSGALDAEVIIPELYASPVVEDILPIRRGEVSLVAEDAESKVPLWLIGVDMLSRRVQSDGQVAEGPSDELSPLGGILSYERILLSPKLQGFLADGTLNIKTANDQHIVLQGEVVPEERGLFSLYDGRVLLADLSLVDELLGAPGTLSEVNVYLKSGVPDEEAKRILEQVLPEDVIVLVPEKRFQRIASTSEALRMNLTFLTALSLFVAILLGYQIFRVVSLRRTGDFSTLTSLGASPKQLATLVVFESLVIGAASGIMGALLGHLFGFYTVTAVQGTIDHLYSPLWESGLQFQASLLIEAVLLGIVVGVLGGASPAQAIYSKPPREYFTRESGEERTQAHVVALSCIGLIAMLFSIPASQKSFLSWFGIAPFIAPSLLSISILCFSPLILLSLKRIVLQGKKYFSPSTLIALQSVTSRLRDSSITVGALAVAFGMLIGVSTMIASFRVTFHGWLGNVLNADLFISHHEMSPEGERIRDEAVVWLRSRPEVAGVNAGKQIRYQYGPSTVFLRYADVQLGKEQGSFVLLEPPVPDWSAMLSGNGVFITEPFSKKFEKRTGDTLELFLNGEHFQFVVVGVLQDFSSDLGAIVFDEALYRETLGSQGVGTGISVYLQEGVSPSRFQESFEQAYPDMFHVRDRAVLKEEALLVFDRTFSITYVLQFLTLMISSLFLVLTLILSVMDRRKEQLTLRSIGAPFAFLRSILLKEGVFLSGCSIFLGLGLGAALSAVLVYRINVLFFGWSVKLIVPFLSTGAFIIGFLVISACICVVIAHRSLKAIPVEVLRYE